jgi:hemoglobin
VYEQDFREAGQHPPDSKPSQEAARWWPSCPATSTLSAMLAGVAAGSTLFERAGGEQFFDTLTRRFYEKVADDPVLRPLYPEDPAGLEAARRHLELFLIERWGGPAVDRPERGDPRLGQRHRRFAIGPAERDAWLRHMTEAVRAGGLRPLDQVQMLSFFEATADHLVNRP